MGASYPCLVSQICDPGVRHLTRFVSHIYDPGVRLLSRFVSQICDRGVRHNPIHVGQKLLGVSRGTSFAYCFFVILKLFPYLWMCVNMCVIIHLLSVKILALV